MEKIGLIYTTMPSEEEAARLAQLLIREGLAACANIMPAHRALYVWDDALCDETEHVLLLKTSLAKRDDLIARLRVIHGYDLPCILTLEAGALPDYAAWLNAIKPIA